MGRISFFERVLRGLLLTLIVIFFLFPIFWILLMSFQTNEQILRIPPSLTFVPSLDNYKALISGHLVTSAGTLDISFMRNLGNSVRFRRAPSYWRISWVCRRPMHSPVSSSG